MHTLRTTVVTIALAVLLVFLQYRLWFESGGIRDMMRVKKMLAMQSAENDKLKKRNDALLTQIQGVQHSNDAAEARARTELGMVKKGETFYQVVK